MLSVLHGPVVPAAALNFVEPAPADSMVSYAWLLVALPLAGAAILLLAGKAADRWGHWLGVAASVGSFGVGLAILVEMLRAGADDRIHQVPIYTWIDAGHLVVEASLRVDPLSMSFVMLVTFVGSLIHIYSVEYMRHDPSRRRFFAYLNLFVAAMLLLVLADSYTLLVMGWEGVGLASYLLIGFWGQRPEYATAAKKAFITMRVSDAGLLSAMLVMFAAFGVTDFSGVHSAVGSAPDGVVTAIGLCLLLAACGKSAQFPLQAWLGDAMAGPTPVSALIHAATMVTAGVYLVVRSGPIFDASPVAQTAVLVVAAFTLIFGAVIGMAKDDIKKVLAASTMSQIGYMMLAAGLGPIGYVFAIFHLITHGFFKAGLFLGAGSVMHGMNDQVDARRFGGLAPYMKVTWITFGLGWLAILGVWPFSGFWSKDKIIEAAFTGDGIQPWILGGITLLGAALTSFYMSRIFFMTFHGKKRWTTAEEGAEQHPHESSALMTVPMIILAVGSVGLGYALYSGHRFEAWLAPVVGETAHLEPVLPVPVLIAATTVLVVLGALLAWRQYAASEVPTEAPRASVLTRAARKDLYQDALNENLFMRPGQYLTRALTYADTAVIDGAVSGAARGTAASGGLLRRLHTGYSRSYAAIMAVGVAVLLVVVLITRF